MRPVGILGGMGPDATVLLMRKVIDAVDAADDADHIPLIVHQNPQVPSRIKALIEGDGDDPGPVLAGMARALETAGAAALAMPCNTAHHYADVIRDAVTIPFLDMVDDSAARLPGDSRVGLLASPAVRLTGIFDRAFSARGVEARFAPDDRVLPVIRGVKSGGEHGALGCQMRELAEGLLEDGAQVVLIACTELSLLTGALEGVPWLDTLDVLVEDIVGFAQSRG